MIGGSFSFQDQTALGDYMTKYQTDMKAYTDLTGQDLTAEMNKEGNALALQLAQMQIDEKQKESIMNALGFILQAGVYIFTGKPPTPAATGTDSANAGPYLVGEKGPEIVIPGQGAQIIPADKTAKMLDPHDGYEAVSRVVDGVKSYFSDKPKPAEKIDKPEKSMGEQLDEYLSYLKGAK